MLIARAQQIAQDEQATFIDMKEILVPIYVIDLAVTVTEQQPLSVVAEFILKLIQEKITDVRTMQQFLGLPIQTVQLQLSELASFSYVLQLANGQYRLTVKGTDYLQDRKLAPVVSTRYSLKYDAITGDLYQLYLCNSKNIQQQQLNVIDARLPIPTVQHFTQRFSEVSTLFSEYQHSLTKKFQHVRFDDILAVTNCFTQYRVLYVLSLEKEDIVYNLIYDNQGIQQPQYEELYRQ